MRLSKRLFPRLLTVLLAATAALAPLASVEARQAVPAERWLHVRVENQNAKGEMVRVNVPLSLAEKVLPAINKDRLRRGKIRIDEANVHGVDLRVVLDAVRAARDGEFVTVQGTTGDVRVVKEAGYLLVHVGETNLAAKHRVEVRAPMTVVDALLSAGTDELDLVAAVRALAAHGDVELVTIKDEKSMVRVWVDSKNTSE